MYCTKCGYELEQGDKFCSKCGVKVKELKVSNENELIDAIEELKRGNENGFTTIYLNTYKYVYSRAKYILHDEQEALDLAQEVYLLLYKNINTLKSNESIYGWLKTVIFRQGIRVIQKKDNNVILTDGEAEIFDFLKDDNAEIEKEYVEKQDVEIIRNCVERLSDEQRLVVLAYYYDNMKVSEIAELLGISEGTVKSRLALARKHLKESISEEEKKCGYKLHSFGGVTLLIAIEAMLNINKNVSSNLKDILFINIGKQLENSIGKLMMTKPNIEETTGVLRNIGKTKSKGSVEVGNSIAKVASKVAVKKIIMTIAAIVVVGTVAGVTMLEEKTTKSASENEQQNTYREHMEFGGKYQEEGNIEKAVEEYVMAKGYYDFSGENDGAYMRLINILKEQEQYDDVKNLIDEIDCNAELEVSQELKSLMDEERGKKWFLVGSRQIIYENEDADIEEEIIDYYYQYDDNGKIIKTNDVNYISKYTTDVEDGEKEYTVIYQDSEIQLNDEHGRLKYKAIYNEDRVMEIYEYNEKGNIIETMDEDEYSFAWDDEDYVTEIYEYYEEWYQELIDDEKYLNKSFSNVYDTHGNLVSRTQYFGEVSQLTLSNYTGMAHLSPAKKDELERKAKELEGCILSKREFRYKYCNIEDMYVEDTEKEEIKNEISVDEWDDFLRHYCNAERNGFPEDTEGINEMFILYGCDVPLEYAIVDLAEDNEPELLISGDNIIYDAFYFLQGEGQVCPLITTEIEMAYETWLGDRARCYIYEEGIIRVEQDINEMNSRSTYYEIADGTSELVFIDSMCMSEGLYYYCDENGIPFTEATEEEYFVFLEKYKEKDISWTKLSDFNE